MCWYITLAVPDRFAEAVRQLTPEHGVKVSESPQTTAASLVPADWSKFLVTRGQCSCDLVHELQAGQERDLALERRKLQKKGWSETKIDRMLKESGEAVERNEASRTAQFSERSRGYNDLVSGLLKQSGSLMLYRHFYSSAIATEELPPPSACTISLGEFLERGFPSDALVTVKGAG